MSGKGRRKKGLAQCCGKSKNPTGNEARSRKVRESHFSGETSPKRDTAKKRRHTLKIKGRHGKRGKDGESSKGRLTLSQGEISHRAPTTQEKKRGSALRSPKGKRGTFFGGGPL